MQRGSGTCLQTLDDPCSDLAGLLDVGRALGDILERVALGGISSSFWPLEIPDVDTGVHGHPTDNLFANKFLVSRVSTLRGPLRHAGSRDGRRTRDLNSSNRSVSLFFSIVDVDGEVGVHVAHLVLEALGDADDQVVDWSVRTVRRAATVLRVPWWISILMTIWLFGLEADGDMAKVLDELSCSRVSESASPIAGLILSGLGYLSGPSTVIDSGPNGDLDCFQSVSGQIPVSSRWPGNEAQQHRGHRAPLVEGEMKLETHLPPESPVSLRNKCTASWRLVSSIVAHRIWCRGCYESGSGEFLWAEKVL